jgi:hypothetical protein
MTEAKNAAVAPTKSRRMLDEAAGEEAEGRKN